MQQLVKKPKLINIISQEENKVLLSLYMPENLIFFQGHFPDLPILPGIAQIDCAIYFACEYLKLSSNQIKQFKNIKFTSIIVPKMIVNLELSIKNNLLYFAYISTSNEQLYYSKGNIPLENNHV